MNRRILAWVLLIGFILLITNLMTIRIYWQASIIIYIITTLFFLFVKQEKVD
jgi:vacuolar-type H+-ATPase subunit I/STV1